MMVLAATTLLVLLFNAVAAFGGRLHLSQSPRTFYFTTSSKETGTEIFEIDGKPFMLALEGHSLNVRNLSHAFDRLHRRPRKTVGFKSNKKVVNEPSSVKTPTDFFLSTPPIVKRLDLRKYLVPVDEDRVPLTGANAQWQWTLLTTPHTVHKRDLFFISEPRNSMEAQLVHVDLYHGDVRGRYQLNEIIAGMPEDQLTNKPNRSFLLIHAFDDYVIISVNGALLFLDRTNNQWSAWSFPDEEEDISWHPFFIDDVSNTISVVMFGGKVYILELKTWKIVGETKVGGEKNNVQVLHASQPEKNGQIQIAYITKPRPVSGNDVHVATFPLVPNLQPEAVHDVNVPGCTVPQLPAGSLKLYRGSLVCLTQKSNGAARGWEIFDPLNGTRLRTVKLEPFLVQKYAKEWWLAGGKLWAQYEKHSGKFAVVMKT